ncbi:MAG: LysM peptidoglycan-binding domain-containing M23 family metallopeptidase [Anaerolineales bacterium]|nr:LysM peptidoglycan-binding domain-containing M23 family metallopeptidase [Anaerolineales bacterium]
MNKIKHIKTIFLIVIFAITSCTSPSNSDSNSASPTAQAGAMNPAIDSTPLPTRLAYAPAELVDYIAQTGDTLPALALRFNTTVDEILSANTFIPRDATTMPPGMPMKIPIYYRALWGTTFQSIPDHAFVNGPTTAGFNTAAFVESQAGWWKNYRAYVSGRWRSGAELVDYVALNYSINPHLLLAILEYQGGALTQEAPPVNRKLLGFDRAFWESHYLQLVIAANTLNNGYYGWRNGSLLEFEDTNNNLFRPDPWQNAGSAALQYYFSRMYSGDDFSRAIGPEGLYQAYLNLFGNPWDESFELIPGSLTQPELTLPFPNAQTWSYTGGPHTGWGTGEPFSALDFAPPSEKSGCVSAKSENYAVAIADGLVVRSSIDGVVLDLDKDGDERTGWVIYYLHLATNQRAVVGANLKAGDLIGYPSCEGGRSTGTHVHISRKYNGEWMIADSAIPFVMDGWIPHNGSRAYLGTLTKGNLTVIACECGDAFTAVNANYP